MWATPRHYRPSASRLLPQMATLLHQSLDPFLGGVAPGGPRLAPYCDPQRPDDLKQVSCLRIASTFIDTIPLKAKANIRYRVAWF